MLSSERVGERNPDAAHERSSFCGRPHPVCASRLMMPLNLLLASSRIR
jgi:hypothetical protein